MIDDRIQVDLALEVGSRDDVLDLDLRLLEDLLATLTDYVRDRADRLFYLLHALPAGADDLAGAEQQDGGLGLLESVNHARELLGFVLGPVEGQGDQLQVEFVTQAGGGHYVLDSYSRHGCIYSI